MAAVELSEASVFDSGTDTRTSVVRPETVSYDPGTDVRTSAVFPEDHEFIAFSTSLFPQQEVLQKVWDTVAGGWVLWGTESIDYDGAEYPGPGAWGAQTSNFRIQNIKFTRV